MGEKLQVFEAEVVAGVYAEAEIVSSARGFDVRSDSSGAVFGIVVGIWFGVEFHAVCACASGRRNIV